MDALEFLVNYGFNLFIILFGVLNLFVSNDNPYKIMSKSASRFIKFMSWSKNKLVRFFELVQSFWRKHKKKIYLSIFIFFFFKGYSLQFVFEIIIFGFYYFKGIFDNSSIHIWSSIFMTVIIALVIYIPYWITVLASSILLFYMSYNQAISRLERNHYDLKAFVKFDTPFVTIVNGEPGKGKTRSITNFGLAAMEVYMDELEENIHDYEMMHPDINWGNYNMSALIDDPKALIDYDYLIKHHPMYYYWSIILYKRKSFLASGPYPILDPYNDDFSVLFDWDWVRLKTQLEDSPIEPYTVICISELDKEYGSHDEMDKDTKKVSRDGLHLFFGTGAHQSDRKGKVFIDYQIATQVPLRIRGNSEMFLWITDSKSKYPFFISIIRLPFLWIFDIVDSIILRYEGFKLKLAKYTRREDKTFRKRYDYTLFYSILRYLDYGLRNVLMWFDHFRFTTFHCDIRDCDGNTTGKVKYHINAQDESWRGSRLYNSTFLKAAYDKRIRELDQDESDKPRWARLRRWTSLDPSEDELKATNSYFINQAFFHLDPQPGTTAADEITPLF